MTSKPSSSVATTWLRPTIATGEEERRHTEPAGRDHLVMVGLDLIVGSLISVDRTEKAAHALLTAAGRSETALHTTQPVVAQVWRTGSRQARLAAFLKAIPIHPPDDGRSVGQHIAQTSTSDVVDAHPVITAVRLGHDILTCDPEDPTTLGAVLGPASPTVHAWP